MVVFAVLEENDRELIASLHCVRNFEVEVWKAQLSPSRPSIFVCFVVLVCSGGKGEGVESNPQSRLWANLR